MFALSLIFNANKGQTAGVTLCSRTGCRKASAGFSLGMVLARGAAWPWWAGQTFPTELGQELGLGLGTLSAAEPPLAFGGAEGGVPLVNSSCGVAFLLLSCELLGLPGSAVSARGEVRPAQVWEGLQLC